MSMQGALLRTYVFANQYKVRRFLRDARRAQSLQRDVLFRKINREMNSGFGQDHGLSEIKNISDFRKQLPISTYEYFRPYVERVKNGEVTALFGEKTKVLMFAMTSGTTSASKYIPITDHFFREYRRSWNVWGLRTYAQHPDLIEKKTLQFSSDWQQSRTAGGFYCGNISGLAADTRPAISHSLFCLPPAINKIHDADAKQYAALRIAVSRSDVGMIITANPLTLIGLARNAEKFQHQLIRDIHDGTWSMAEQVPAQVRGRLGSLMSVKNPGRARQLESIASRTGHLWPRDYWPNLSVLAIWTGGSVGSYIPQVKEYYGDVTFRDHGLSASEGRMTTPLEAESRAGVLDVATHYYEFIPEEEHGRPDPTILEAHELELGKKYFLIMTTSSGLWRHDIHDVVQCVGFEGQAPLLEFLNKGAHYSSMTGEKLSEHQVVQAVTQALAKMNVVVEHFTLAPVQGDPPHYSLLIETQLPDDTRQQLGALIDHLLSDANCEFENRIATKRIRPTEIRSLPPGTWQRFHQAILSRQGASVEQFKHPCLTNKLDFIDHLTPSNQQPQT